MGVDRHLLGLKKMALMEGGKLPDIFADPAFEWSKLWLLSTSNCTSPNLVLFAFGPVFERCVGVGYMVNYANISFNISTKHLGSDSFRRVLRQSMLNMAAVLDAEPVVHRAKL